MLSMAISRGCCLFACVCATLSSIAEMRPLTSEGRAEAWLSGGVWMGPGGLSLLGVDCEGDIRPSLGDAVPNKSFDETRWGEWTALPHSMDCYVISDRSPDLSWAGGCAYAQLYIRADEARMVTLRLKHGGHSTVAWVNGRFVPETRLSFDRRKKTSEGTTDQGNRIKVETEVGVLTSEMRFPLLAGHNRILLKFYLKQEEGVRVFFDARFVDPGGLASDVVDPETDITRHSTLGRMRADVTVSALANLPHEGDALTVRTAVIGPWHEDKKKPIRKAVPFSAFVEQVVCDWDGRETARVSYPIDIPGTNTAELCKAGPVGYYAIHTAIRTSGRGLLQGASR